ncbi:MAG: hypothetical protein KTR31_17175 [Myxococcales bacterium]|nr:hypothetical protein [Myxococcales bacterium]
MDTDTEGRPSPVVEPPHQAFAGFLIVEIAFSGLMASYALAWARQQSPDTPYGDHYTAEFIDGAIHIVCDSDRKDNPGRSCIMSPDDFISGVERYQQAVASWKESQAESARLQ